jgi:hypothetical protein
MRGRLLRTSPVKHSLVGLTALILSAAPALAQAPSPPPPAPGSPPPPHAAGPGEAGPRGGRGAFIKLRSPEGAEVSVRCSDGDSTSECVELVGKLLERAKAMRPSGDDRRGGGRDDDRDRNDRWERDGRYRDRY